MYSKESEILIIPNTSMAEVSEIICFTFCFWCIISSDVIENVNEYKEERDEESHSAWNDVRRYNKTDPRHNHK